MTPDFEDKERGVQLYLGDCLQILPHLSGIDAVVTDPPYGINLLGSFNNSKRLYRDGSRRIPKVQYVPKIIGDKNPFDPLPWLPFAKVVLWGAQNYAAKLPASTSWLVWDKRCGLIPERTQADCEMAWTNATHPARMFRHIWDGMVRDSERDEVRVHPTQKPVALIAWCLNQIDVPIGATVLDPYAGSGTTAVACLRTGRKSISIEIDPHYFQVAKERIQRELAQGVLL